MTTTSERDELERRYSKHPGLSYDIDNPERYSGFSAESLATFCRIKDRSNDIFVRRVEAAQEVIDLLARKVGIDPEACGLCLYTLDLDGSSPIIKKMDEFFSRSGEKAKLKKRLDELENENSVLRSLLSK